MKKDKKSRQLLIVPSGTVSEDGGFEDREAVMSEFDIQKTAESENFYPAIAQGIPISGFKDAVKKDKTR